ncbi:MAG: hypothetical protein ACQETH_05550 [Candidatus Rifleibacteriota bacterium]
MGKRGIAVPTALILISILLVFFLYMQKHTSQEMVYVKDFYEAKRAENLAYSGLNWAEAQLIKKRWWVDEGFDSENKVSRATADVITHEFFGPQNGKATVIAEEFASANPSPVKGYDKIQRLDHIRVYSVGEYEGKRVLVLGKFIISPEPFLNSDSTESAESETAPVTVDGTVTINVPQPWSQDGPVPELMIVKKVNASVGQKVDPNSILATLGAHPDDPVQITMTWDIKAPAIGTLTKVNFQPGMPIRAGDIFGECTDELMMTQRTNKTLKKMVRVTKVTDRGITDQDLTDFAIRRKLLDPLFENLSDAYVLNYSKNQPYINSLENSFNSPVLGKVADTKEVLDRLDIVPGTTDLSVQEAGNNFLDEMIEKWVMPGLVAGKRPDFPENSEYHLGIGKSTPRKEIMEVLEHFDKLDEIVTRPQRNPELYEINSTEAFKELMNFNNRSKNTDDYVHDVSFLRDAAKKISIVLDKGTPWEDAPFKEMVKNGEVNPDDYWWWPSKQGWYREPDITITEVEIPYNFVNDTPENPFVMELGFVLNYLRKHYDEGMAVPPGGTIRLPSDQQDEPQAPGPPDSTGAKYSGLSS